MDEFSKPWHVKWPSVSWIFSSRGAWIDSSFAFGAEMLRSFCTWRIMGPVTWERKQQQEIKNKHNGHTFSQSDLNNHKQMSLQDFLLSLFWHLERETLLCTFKTQRSIFLKSYLFLFHYNYHGVIRKQSHPSPMQPKYFHCYMEVTHIDVLSTSVQSRMLKMHAIPNCMH